MDSDTSSAAEDLAITALHMARRFAAGATLWCVAPEWPAHASHLAVEFVHPVVLGARSLPAVAVPSPLVARLRCLARNGDLLVAVASGAHPEVADLMRRAEAWGLSSVWLASGSRPSPGSADSIVFLDDTPPAPAASALVLSYHLLWELTQVCFEHPGLLRRPGPEPEVACVTCSDEGRPAEIVATGAGNTAEVRTPRGRETVDVGLISGAQPGDLVLVHGGFAVALLAAAGAEVAAT